jgi:hypothetical protein
VLSVPRCREGGGRHFSATDKAPGFWRSLASARTAALSGSPIKAPALPGILLNLIQFQTGSGKKLQ